MIFTYGCTRWVILTENYAIKIARFRPIRPFVRFLHLLGKGEVIERMERHDLNPAKAILKYLGAGIVANRTEYQLYKKYGGELLAPTLFTVCWLINIQRRGEPSREEDVQRHYLWNVLRGTGTPLSKDILQSKQFCMIDGKTYLADYGNEFLEPVLSAYH